MPSDYNDAKEEIRELDAKLNGDNFVKALWIVIPIAIGGIITAFTGAHQDIQIIAWGVMFLIASMGLWGHNARIIRKKAEALERKRWDDLYAQIDARFDEVDQRFNEVDKRFDLSEATDKTLLRSELISFHREWAEEKGYITLEALEYIDRIHDQYNAVGGNDTGDKLWQEIHRLEVNENRKK